MAADFDGRARTPRHEPRGGEPLADPPRRRRAEALAALVPFAGLFLLMPPFIGVFAHDGRLLGAPTVLIFLLAAWLGLILATRWLSRRLSGRPPEG